MLQTKKRRVQQKREEKNIYKTKTQTHTRIITITITNAKAIGDRIAVEVEKQNEVTCNN